MIALLAIYSFHVGAAVLMGLPWFSLAMTTIDATFIRDRTWKARPAASENATPSGTKLPERVRAPASAGSETMAR